MKMVSCESHCFVEVIACSYHAIRSAVRTGDSKGHRQIFDGELESGEGPWAFVLKAKLDRVDKVVASTFKSKPVWSFR